MILDVMQTRHRCLGATGKNQTIWSASFHLERNPIRLLPGALVIETPPRGRARNPSGSTIENLRLPAALQWLDAENNR